MSAPAPIISNFRLLPYEFAPDAFAYAVVERGPNSFFRHYLAMPALRQIDDNDGVVGEIFRQVEHVVVERYARGVIAREIAEESIEEESA